MQTWIKTKKNLALFITYLAEQGYEVQEYSWPKDEREPLSWGLEFNDDNPAFVALRLKHMGNE